MTAPARGRADFWKGGTWNAVCFECGCKMKANELKRHWQGYWVCPEHWEPRHPQDFVKAIPDNMGTPWAQSPQDRFVGICTLEGRQGLAGAGVAGCMIADTVFPKG